MEELTSIELPQWGYPYPISMDLDGGSDGGTDIH